jgi:hypothetical protein
LLKILYLEVRGDSFLTVVFYDDQKKGYTPLFINKPVARGSVVKCRQEQVVTAKDKHGEMVKDYFDYCGEIKRETFF